MIIVLHNVDYQEEKHMKAAYPTILTKVDDVILVEVPDLEILTEGKDISDAIDMARDAIGITGIILQDLKQEISEPPSLQDVDPQKGTFASDGSGIVTLVDIDFNAYPGGSGRSGGRHRKEK